MLYKFQSRATPDLIMLEPHGRRILEILGKSPEGHGILTVEQLPAAIEKLQHAIVEDEQRKAQAEAELPPEELEQLKQDPSIVYLRQRVAPFIEMLRRSLAEEREVVW